MVLDCCAQLRTYEKYYGLLAQRFCMLDKKYIGQYSLSVLISRSSPKKTKKNKKNNKNRNTYCLLVSAKTKSKLYHLKVLQLVLFVDESQTKMKRKQEKENLSLLFRNLFESLLR